jgi:hypothetical protein
MDDAGESEQELDELQSDDEPAEVSLITALASTPA